MPVSSLQPGPAILVGQAVNRSHPLNRSRDAWWLNLPGRMSGPTWYDLCGRYHGTLAGGPARVGTSRPGAWGSLSFDSVDDSCTIVGAGNWSLAGGQTIALWYRPRYTIADSAIRGIMVAGAYGNGLQIVKYSDNNLYAGVDGGSRVSPAAASVLTSGAWNHLCLVLSPTAGVTLSVNGVSVATSGTSITWTGVGDPMIGVYSIDYALADFDDVSRFSRPFSSAEVVQLYALSRCGYPGVLNRFGLPAGAGEPAAAAFSPAWAAAAYQPAIGSGIY